MNERLVIKHKGRQISDVSIIPISGLWIGIYVQLYQVMKPIYQCLTKSCGMGVVGICLGTLRNNRKVTILLLFIHQCSCITRSALLSPQILIQLYNDSLSTSVYIIYRFPRSRLLASFFIIKTQLTSNNRMHIIFSFLIKRHVIWPVNIVKCVTV